MKKSHTTKRSANRTFDKSKFRGFAPNTKSKTQQKKLEARMANLQGV